MNNTHSSDVHMHKAEDIFRKPIPFKIYCIDNRAVGTIEHTHNYMQIWYVMSGYCEHLINNKSHRLVKGDLFVLPPFVTHRIKFIEGMDIRIIGCEFLVSLVSENMPGNPISTSLFSFAYLEPFLVSTDAVRPRLNLNGRNQAKVEELLEEMLVEYQQEKKYYEINIKADLLKLLAIVAREYDNHDDLQRQEIIDRYKDAVSKAIKYVDENYTQSIYIKDICKIAMMSQTYFSYIFSQITGKTFTEYVNDQRIRKACDLLKNSSMSVTEICYEAGYNDIAYFSRVFKKGTGLSPRKYRLFSRGN